MALNFLDKHSQPRYDRLMMKQHERLRDLINLMLIEIGRQQSASDDKTFKALQQFSDDLITTWNRNLASLDGVK